MINRKIADIPIISEGASVCTEIDAVVTFGGAAFDFFFDDFFSSSSESTFSSFIGAFNFADDLGFFLLSFGFIDFRFFLSFAGEKYDALLIKPCFRLHLKYCLFLHYNLLPVF